MGMEMGTGIGRTGCHVKVKNNLGKYSILYTLLVWVPFSFVRLGCVFPSRLVRPSIWVEYFMYPHTAINRSIDISPPSMRQQMAEMRSEQVE